MDMRIIRSAGLLAVASQFSGEPVLGDDVRFHSPLRGSAGFAPDFPLAFSPGVYPERETDVRATIPDAHPNVNP
jgi:hypothetical protein